MLQLLSLPAATKIPHATTKTRWSQINKSYQKKIEISNGQHRCVMLFIQHDNPCILTRMLSPLQLVQLFELVMYVFLVFWGCRNKTPQTGWLKQQKLTFSGFWKLEVQDKSTSRAGPSYGNCLQTTAYLGPHVVFPQRVLLVSLSLKDTGPSESGANPYNHI